MSTERPVALQNRPIGAISMKSDFVRGNKYGIRYSQMRAIDSMLKGEDDGAYNGTPSERATTKLNELTAKLGFKDAATEWQKWIKAENISGLDEYTTAKLARLSQRYPIE